VDTLQSARPEDLVDWVEAAAEPGTPLWLYGHHVAVDVQSSQLLEALLRRGWRLSRHGLANTSMWALLVKGRQSVHLCDSVSLFGCSVDRLGQLLELPKLEMPGPEAELEEWFAYCWRDVEVVLRALLECMANWERLQLGRWTDTGPGCGWNSLRHRLTTGAIWVDPDPDGRAFERSAIFGGRRELLRWGKWPEAEYADLDLEHAHLSVAAARALPCSRGPRFESLPLKSAYIGGAGVGVIARARVRCVSPRYPLRTSAGVLYPVGEFETTLCGPELAWARERGELLSIGAGYTYRLSHWAASWAGWVSQVLDGAVEEVGPMLRQLLKGASKTVWGRSAMRITGTVQRGDGPTEELRLERGYDQSRQCGLTIVDWGWGRTIELQDQEADDSFPAILAWIQSWVRVVVGRLVDEIGPEAVAAIATDGVLVAPWRLAELALEPEPPAADLEFTSQVAEAACEYLEPAVWPLRVRLKDVLHQVAAMGPETIEAAERRVVSGVPQRAERVAPWTYQGEVWPSFVTMTQAPWTGAVLVSERVWRCDAARPLRWVYQDGVCEPLWAAVRALDGVTECLGPPGAPVGRHGPLIASQHPALLGVLVGRPLEEVRGGGARPGG